MELETMADVARSRARAGQVLLYPGHTPPGLFVVLDGALLRLVATTDGALRSIGPALDAADGAFVVPAVGELARPARLGLVVARDVALLFVPRSVALAGGAVARELAREQLVRLALGGPDDFGSKRVVQGDRG